MFKSKSLLTISIFLLLTFIFTIGFRKVYSSILDWQEEQIPHYQTILKNKNYLWLGPEIGEQIEIINLTNKNSQTLTSKINGKRTLLIYVHPNCGMCRIAVDQMQVILEEAERKSLETAIVSFHPKIELSSIEKYAQANNLKTNIYTWNKKNLEAPPAVLVKMGTPSYIIINSEGVIEKKFPGSHPNSRTRRAMTKEIVREF